MYYGSCLFSSIQRNQDQFVRIDERFLMMIRINEKKKSFHKRHLSSLLVSSCFVSVNVVK